MYQGFEGYLRKRLNSYYSGFNRVQEYSRISGTPSGTGVLNGGFKEEQVL